MAVAIAAAATDADSAADEVQIADCEIVNIVDTLGFHSSQSILILLVVGPAARKVEAARALFHEGHRLTASTLNSSIYAYKVP